MREKILLVMLLSVLGLGAQEQHAWEQYIGQVMTAEDMASEEWQTNYDLLCDLEQSPININMASREDLEQLPFLSVQQVEALMEYIYRYGGMKSTAELQMIREIDAHTRKLLECFVYAGEEKKTNPRTRHELTADVKLNSRHWLRYQMERGERLKIGLVASQDDGEPFFSGKNKLGYDYYSPYLLLKKTGRMETLVVGNFRAQMGMGMVMNNSFSMGKIATLQNLGRNNNGLRAHSSRMQGYLQGIGATINLGRGLKTMVFAAYTPMDATLNKDGSARTILTTGYHRTETELAKKNNLHALKTGGTVRLDVGRLHLALNTLYAHLDRRLTPDKKQQYNRYKPEGSNFINSSVDYGYRGRRWVLNGETAIDGNGHIATINTLSVTTNSGLSVMALQRFYSYQYSSLDAQSYSDGGRVQNESGVYIGLKWQPSPRWQLAAYTDYAYHPWATYRKEYSTYSWDNLLQSTYSGKHWKFTGRYRIKARDHEHRGRLIAEYTTKNLTSRTQIDAGFCGEKDGEKGVRVSESAAWTYRWLRLNVGAGYFNTDGYNSRVYLYESGPLYTYNMMQFYGEGMRYWLMARAQIGRKLTLTAKLGATDNFGRKDKTDVDFQVRMKI